jgi:hypothetical protein
MSDLSHKLTDARDAELAYLEERIHRINDERRDIAKAVFPDLLRYAQHYAGGWPDYEATAKQALKAADDFLKVLKEQS